MLRLDHANVLDSCLLEFLHGLIYQRLQGNAKNDLAALLQRIEDDLSHEPGLASASGNLKHNAAMPTLYGFPKFCFSFYLMRP